MSIGRHIADKLSLRVLFFVILGFVAVALPSYFAFNWIAGQTVIQLGTLFAEKQVLYDRHRGLGALTREVSLAETLAGSQAIRDWALDENNEQTRRRGIAELEHFRQNFADRSYFFVIDKSGNYYFNDAANAYAGNQLRYAVDAENPRDAWYFTTRALGEGCHLNVDNDANLRVTKVWMNCVIREGHNVLGILGTGIDLSAFIQEVVNVPQPGISSMFIDRMGRVQAHRNPDLVNLRSLSEEMRDKRTVFSMVESEDDRQTIRQLMTDVVNGAGAVSSAFVPVDGKQQLLGIGYLEQLGWFNVTLMDVDTIIDRRLFLPIGALLVGVISLVAFVLVLVFKKTVLDRLSHLEQLVRRARQGDYAAAMDKYEGPQDEIGRLTIAFSEMAKAVDDNTRMLEQRVEERTSELQSLAFKDGQTGLLNRRGFTAAHAEIAQQGSYGLLLIDIDRFKAVNDTHGHSAGDAVVAEIAQRIQSVIDERSRCVRWGGDEFGVLIPLASANTARACAYAIMAAINKAPVQTLEGAQIAVTASVGACIAEAGDALEVATDMADVALYMAKEQGRNMVVLFDADMAPNSRRA